MNLLFILLSGVVGLVLGILVMFGISKAGLNKDQQKAAQILEHRHPGGCEGQTGDSGRPDPGA